MKITELLLAELDREAVGIRKTLERVPEGKNDWKPHEKSMPLGYSGDHCCHHTGMARHGREHGRVGHQSARRPEVQTAAMEDAPRTAGTVRSQPEEGTRGPAEDHGRSPAEYQMAYARRRAKLMSEQPRYDAIRDGVLNHMAHHRGQLTVYLRLNEEKVPAIYGPSADEGKG